MAQFFEACKKENFQLPVLANEKISFSFLQISWYNIAELTRGILAERYAHLVGAFCFSLPATSSGFIVFGMYIL